MTSRLSSLLPIFRASLSPCLQQTVRHISFSGQEVTTQYTSNPKPKPGPDNPLTFGSVTTDHMFMADWKLGEGWKRPRIVPYQPLMIDPTAKVLHYAAEIFEGMKAYLGDDKKLRLFRPMKNMDRFYNSAIKTALPLFDKLELKECIKVSWSIIPLFSYVLSNDSLTQFLLSSRHCCRSRETGRQIGRSALSTYDPPS